MAKKMAKQERLWTKSFVLLTVGHLLQALGYSSLLLFPLYLVHLGASRAQIGLIMGVASVGSLCVRPAVGWALDGWGRKPTLMIGTVLLTLGMFLIALVVELGWFVVVVRLLIGLGIGALFSGYFTYASDIIPASRRTEGLALFGVSGLVPLLINPFSRQIGISSPGLRWFFPCVGLLIGLSLFALWPLREESRAATKHEIRLAKMWGEMWVRPLLPVWLATIVFSGLVATVMTFATVTAQSRGVADPTLLWLTYAGGAISIRIFGARIPDRVGTSNIVAPALGLYIAAMLLIAGATSSEMFMLVGLLGGIGHGYCFPVLTSQVVSRVHASFRGSALSFFTALWGIAEIGLTPLLGLFADHYGDSAMFSFAALCGTVLLACWAWMEHRMG